MNIRFVSSLTPEDENAFAQGILKACTSVLDLFPIAYTLRIETSDSQVYQQSRPGQTIHSIQDASLSKAQDRR